MGKLLYVFYLLKKNTSIKQNRTGLISKRIIEECRNGDFTNFGEVVSEYSPFAYSVAFRMTGDDTQAREIVQESMITVWQKIGRINSPEAFRTWLYRIVINKCYDCLRERKRDREIRISDAGWSALSAKMTGGSSDSLELEETAALISRLTQKLSPKQKAIFVFCELEDLSYDEVSEITGDSSSNIKANLHYARKRISEMIEKYL